MRLILFFCLALGAPAWASEETADFMTHHEEMHGLSLSFDLDMLGSSLNYSSDGSSNTPTGLNNVDYEDLKGRLSYGLTDQWSLFGVLDLRRADVSGTAASGTAYGFGDQMLGVNYRALESGLTAIDVQFELGFPAYGNDPTTLPNLGDGSEDLTLSALARLSIYSDSSRDILVLPSFGYTYRTDGFSAALPWSLRVAYAEHTGWTPSVGLQGEESLGTDSRMPNPLTSFVTGAVNPTWIAAVAAISYRFNPSTEACLNGSESIYGENAADQYTIGASLTIHWPQNSSASPDTNPGRTAVSTSGYDLQATVLSANDSFHLAKIDRGSNEGIQLGDVFDVFGPSGDPIAQCRVTNLKPHESALKVEHYYKEVWIEPGDTARRKK